MQPAAIVFDLDDTLIASGRARLRRLRQLLGPDADLRRVRRIAEQCWDRYKVGEWTWDQQRRNRWIATGVPAERALEVDDEYRRYYDSIRMRQGAARLLRDLRRYGYRLALLSNSEPDYVNARLGEHGIGEAFDVVFETIPPRRKPQLDVFLEVAADLGAGLARTVMVGDSLEMDVLPALDCGYVHAYWMTSSRRPLPDRTTRVANCKALAGLLS